MQKSTMLVFFPTSHTINCTGPAGDHLTRRCPLLAGGVSTSLLTSSPSSSWSQFLSVSSLSAILFAIPPALKHTCSTGQQAAILAQHSSSVMAFHPCFADDTSLLVLVATGLMFWRETSPLDL